MPKPSTPALEGIVRSHSAQLTKLNSELSSAFSQVTAKMGEIKSSSAAAASTIASLANQVVTLTNMLAKLLPAPLAVTSPTLPPVLPAASAPAAPQGESLDPRWEPNPPFPKHYSGNFDQCLGFLEECQDFVRGPTLLFPVRRGQGGTHPLRPDRPGSGLGYVRGWGQPTALFRPGGLLCRVLAGVRPPLERGRCSWTAAQFPAGTPGHS